MPRLTVPHDIATVFGFLTRIPIRATYAPSRPLARASWAFPLVGVVVGGIGGAMCLLAGAVGLSPLIGALIAVGATALATGALHEDGLADVADGFGGGRDRESILTIMRDSRIGTFGVVALIVVVGCRVAALSEAGEPMNTLVIAAVLSRAAMVPVMAILPNARTEGLGVGAGKPSIACVLIAIAIAIGLAAVLIPPLTVLAAIVAAGFAALCVSLMAMRKIGGTTGDVLGTVQQTAEALILSVLVATV